MATIQHSIAEKLLPMIMQAATTGEHFTYAEAAERLGRPRDHARAIAQVCDLLDAAAAYGGAPLLALVTVLESSGQVNTNAWVKEGWDWRDEVIARSQSYKFDIDDFRAIQAGLQRLGERSNRAAWRFVREHISENELRRRIGKPITEGTGTRPYPLDDAIDDLGSDYPERKPGVANPYKRDSRVRDAVKKRAKGRCEFCGELGFLQTNGKRYTECHHIIALANDGADRLSNVIALCPKDHREAHFGMRSAELEAAMIEKLREITAR
jgi:hypothetical protein